MLLPQSARIFKDVDESAAGFGMKVVTITRENVARVARPSHIDPPTSHGIYSRRIAEWPGISDSEIRQRQGQ
jgi:hypothetical protein